MARNTQLTSYKPTLFPFALSYYVSILLSFPFSFSAYVFSFPSHYDPRSSLLCTSSLSVLRSRQDLYIRIYQKKKTEPVSWPVDRHTADTLESQTKHDYCDNYQAYLVHRKIV